MMNVMRLFEVLLTYSRPLDSPFGGVRIDGRNYQSGQAVSSNIFAGIPSIVYISFPSTSKYLSRSALELAGVDLVRGRQCNVVLQLVLGRLVKLSSVGERCLDGDKVDDERVLWMLKDRKSVV